MTDSIDQFLNTLRCCAESTRLRIVVALSRHDLTISELTHILGQSQPRVSRHVKLLVDAALVDRHREGGSIFCRLRARDDTGDISDHMPSLVSRLIEALPESACLVGDRRRLLDILDARSKRATAYFDAHADAWDELRGRHIDDAALEARLSSFVPSGSDLLVDLGTGTGRMLEVFGAGAKAAIGFDISVQMLNLARARISAAGLMQCQLRQADVQSLPLTDSCADVAILHQVLHFLDSPLLALRETSRILRPDGRIIIIDFAPHDLEFLRKEHVHRRLGFAATEVSGWLIQSGFTLFPTVHLAARDKNGLTVSIWSGRRNGI